VETDKEIKNRRVFLLWHPSLHDDIKFEAAKCHESVNDYVHTVLKYAMSDIAFKEDIRNQIRLRKKPDIARAPDPAGRAKYPPHSHGPRAMPGAGRYG
jgi:hypothetical protein